MQTKQEKYKLLQALNKSTTCARQSGFTSLSPRPNSASWMGFQPLGCLVVDMAFCLHVMLGRASLLHWLPSWPDQSKLLKHSLVMFYLCCGLWHPCGFNMDSFMVSTHARLGSVIWCSMLDLGGNLSSICIGWLCNMYAIFPLASSDVNYLKLETIDANNRAAIISFFHTVTCSLIIKAFKKKSCFEGGFEPLGLFLTHDNIINTHHQLVVFDGHKVYSWGHACILKNISVGLLNVLLRNVFIMGRVGCQQWMCLTSFVCVCHPTFGHKFWLAPDTHTHSL